MVAANGSDPPQWLSTHPDPCAGLAEMSKPRRRPDARLRAGLRLPPRPEVDKPALNPPSSAPGDFCIAWLATDRGFPMNNTFRNSAPRRMCSQDGAGRSPDGGCPGAAVGARARQEGTGFRAIGRCEEGASCDDARRPSRRGHPASAPPSKSCSRPTNRRMRKAVPLAGRSDRGTRRATFTNTRWLVARIAAVTPAQHRQRQGQGLPRAGRSPFDGLSNNEHHATSR